MASATDSDPYSHSYANTDSYTDSYTNTHSDAYTGPYAHTYPYSTSRTIPGLYGAAECILGRSRAYYARYRTIPEPGYE